MSDVVQEHIDIYRERVNVLYLDVQKWVEPLTTKMQEVEVLERVSGSYAVRSLEIMKSDGSEVIRLEPVGTWIIGAEGRVDLKGYNGKEVIIYLTNDGPALNFSETESDGETSKSTMALFQGVEQDGWYWIEDSRRGRARLMTQELFRDLVSEVSDYAFE